MVAKKVEEKPVEPSLEEQKEEAAAKLGHISNWEFLLEPPTSEKVLTLLATLPPVHGIKHVDFADFVQALPQKKSISVPHPTNPRLKVEEKIENWVLYMSVAGRQAMLNAAAEKNRWRVEIEPEPNSPVGAPGFLSMETRIVYREYIKIWQYLKPIDLDQETTADRDTAIVGEVYLGVRNGMAWVPFSGGTNAAASNPYEKVETSARGRALGAWGFGVFPGSGIASLEEMQGVAENKQAMDADRGGQRGQGPAENTRRPGREDLLEKTLTAVESLRQATNDSEEGITAKVGTYVSKTLGSMAAYDPERNELHWDGLKDGQLMMLEKFLSQKVAQIHGEL